MRSEPFQYIVVREVTREIEKEGLAKGQEHGESQGEERAGGEEKLCPVRLTS